MRRLTSSGEKGRSLRAMRTLQGCWRKSLRKQRKWMGFSKGHEKRFAYRKGGYGMVLDVIVNDSSISIQIEDPFHPDLDAIMGQIERAASSYSIDINGLDIRGLIQKMIGGIAGCE